MQFISTQSKDDSLYHYTLYLLGKTSTDTTSYTSTDWVRSAKTYCRKAGYLAWQNASGWKFDDSNYTSLPIATTTLVNGQGDYAMPTGILDIDRVEVLDDSGDYKLLNRMTKKEVKEYAISEYYKTDGLPKYWYPEGNSIFLKPEPATGSVTMVEGLKLYLSRDITAPTMTTGNGALREIITSPGFQVSFHPYVAIGCAVDYGVSKNYTQQKMDNLRASFREYESGIADYYSRRDREYPVKFRPAIRSSI